MTSVRDIALGQIRLNFNNVKRDVDAIDVADGRVADLVNNVNHRCFGPLKMVLQDINKLKEGGSADEKVRMEELEGKVIEGANELYRKIEKILVNEEKYITALASANAVLTSADAAQLNKRIENCIVLLGVLKEMNIGMPATENMLESIKNADKEFEMKLSKSIEANTANVSVQSKMLVKSKTNKRDEVKTKMLEAQSLLEAVKSRNNEVSSLYNESNKTSARIVQNSGTDRDVDSKSAPKAAFEEFQKVRKQYESLVNEKLLAGVENDAGFKNTIKIITGLMQMQEELNKSNPDIKVIQGCYKQVIMNLDKMSEYYLLDEDVNEHNDIVASFKETLSIFDKMGTEGVTNHNRKEGLLAISGLITDFNLQNRMAPQFLMIALEKGSALSQDDIFRLLFQSKTTSSSVLNRLSFSADGSPLSSGLWSQLMEGERGRELGVDIASCIKNGEVDNEQWQKFAAKYKVVAAEGSPEKFIKKLSGAISEYHNFKNTHARTDQSGLSSPAPSADTKMRPRLSSLSRTTSFLRPRSDSIQSRPRQDSAATPERRLSHVSFTADQLNKIGEMKENEKNQDKCVAAKVKQIVSSQSDKPTPEETQAKLVQAEELRDNARLYISYLQTLPANDEVQAKIKDLSANSHVLNTYIYNLTHPKLEKQSSVDRPAAKSAPARMEQTENSPEAVRFSPADLDAKYKGVRSVTAMLTKPESVSAATIEKALSLHQELVTYFNDFVKTDPNPKEVSKATTVLIELKTVKSTYDRAAKLGIKHVEEPVKPALVGSHHKAPSS